MKLYLLQPLHFGLAQYTHEPHW